MVFLTMINGKEEIITDENNAGNEAIIKRIEAMSVKGNLRVFWRKERVEQAVGDDGKTTSIKLVPVNRWALFEYVPSTGQMVLKLEWQTDKGEYVPLNGSRFQDNPNENIRKKGNIFNHIEYQRISRKGGRGMARFRRQQGVDYYKQTEEKRDSMIGYMVKHDRRYMQKIARDFTDKPEDIISIPK